MLSLSSVAGPGTVGSPCLLQRNHFLQGRCGSCCLSVLSLVQGQSAVPVSYRETASFRVAAGHVVPQFCRWSRDSRQSLSPTEKPLPSGSLPVMLSLSSVAGPGTVGSPCLLQRNRLLQGRCRSCCLSVLSLVQGQSAVPVSYRETASFRVAAGHVVSQFCRWSRDSRQSLSPTEKPPPSGSLPVMLSLSSVAGPGTVGSPCLLQRNAPLGSKYQKPWLNPEESITGHVWSCVKCENVWIMCEVCWPSSFRCVCSQDTFISDSPMTMSPRNIVSLGAWSLKGRGPFKYFWAKMLIFDTDCVIIRFQLQMALQKQQKT